jgi:heme ABC exporter ATP-binding subunit CcmA
MPQTTIYVAPRRTGAPPPAVETIELARLFGRSAALAGVSLRVDGGRTVALLGPNGAGKTTLLRILATALRPSFGVARVNGIDVADDPARVRGQIAYLPHATGLYDDLTGQENLAFAASMLGHHGTEASDRVRDALARVGMLSAGRQPARGYSAGMRRRLALGRLLLHDAPLVLLDEPHASLDAEAAGLVDRLLAHWQAEGQTVLIASHQADRVLAAADGWARLDGGLLTEVGGFGIAHAPAREAGAVTPLPAGVGR